MDLRSDTVTQPTSAMRDAMIRADVGDDVYGEDATINALEQRVAQWLGKEEALFCSSGTQSNLLGLLSHCRNGEEYNQSLSIHLFFMFGHKIQHVLCPNYHCLENPK